MTQTLERYESNGSELSSDPSSQIEPDRSGGATSRVRAVFKNLAHGNLETIQSLSEHKGKFVPFLRATVGFQGNKALLQVECTIAPSNHNAIKFGMSVRPIMDDHNLRTGLDGCFDFIKPRQTQS